MIKTIDDVLTYFQERKNEKPLLSDSMLSKDQRVDVKQIKKVLKRFPNLPPNYKNIIETMNIIGKVIGGFSLTPPMAGSFFEQLEVMNNPEMSPMFKRAGEMGLLIVAAYEGDPIAIAVDCGAYPIDSVLWFDLRRVKESPFLVANTFEEFISLATNLFQLILAEEKSSTGMRTIVNTIVRSNAELIGDTWDYLEKCGG